MYLLIDGFGRVVEMATTYEKALRVQQRLSWLEIPTSIEFSDDEGDWDYGE